MEEAPPPDIVSPPSFPLPFPILPPPPFLGPPSLAEGLFPCGSSSSSLLLPPPHPLSSALMGSPSPSSEMFQEPWQKPPYSYIALITMAISSNPEKRMTLSQVSKRLTSILS